MHLTSRFNLLLIYESTKVSTITIKGCCLCDGIYFRIYGKFGSDKKGHIQTIQTGFSEIFSRKYNFFMNSHKPVKPGRVKDWLMNVITGCMWCKKSRLQISWLLLEVVENRFLSSVIGSRNIFSEIYKFIEASNDPIS